VKREPFRPPAREPLPEEDANEILAPFPVVLLNPDNLPEVVPPAEAVQPGAVATAVPDEPSVAPPSPVPDEPPPANAHPDEFGAGLDDSTAEPKA
jgi:hypothetical protein